MGICGCCQNRCEKYQVVETHLFAIYQTLRLSLPFTFLIIFFVAGCLKIHFEQCGIEVHSVAFLNMFLLEASFKEDDELLRVIDKGGESCSRLDDIILKRWISGFGSGGFFSAHIGWLCSCCSWRGDTWPIRQGYKGSKTRKRTRSSA